jgi:hypothetical protein
MRSSTGVRSVPPDQKCTCSAYLCRRKVLSGPATLYMMLASKAPTLKRHPLHPYHNTLLELQKKAKNTHIPHITNRQSELRHCYFTPDSIQPELQRSHQMSIQYAWLILKLQVSKTQVIQFFSWSKPAITSKLRAEREGKQKKTLPRQFFTTYTTEDFWSRQIPTYSRNLTPKRIEQSTIGTSHQRSSANI